MKLFKKLSVSLRRLNSPDASKDCRCEGQDATAKFEPRAARRQGRSGRTPASKGAVDGAQTGSPEFLSQSTTRRIDTAASLGSTPSLALRGTASTEQGQRQPAGGNAARAGTRTRPAARNSSGHERLESPGGCNQCEENLGGGAEQRPTFLEVCCAPLPDHVRAPQALSPPAGACSEIDGMCEHLSNRSRQACAGLWSSNEASVETDAPLQSEGPFEGGDSGRHSPDVRSINQFSFLPDVCVRLCFSFLTVEEVIRYQVICKDVQRAIGLELVAWPADARKETTLRKQCGDCFRPCSAELPKLPSNGLDGVAEGSSSADSGSSDLGLRRQEKGSKQLYARDSSSSSGGEPALDWSTTLAPTPAPCLFGSYPALTVGMSWMAAPSAVRLAYLSHFRSLRELKIFFCSRLERQRGVGPTAWPDVWLLLKNNQKTLQRLSLVTLPYDATALARLKQDPQKPGEECRDAPVTPECGTQDVLEAVADPWDRGNDLAVLRSTRDQIPASHTDSPEDVREGSAGGTIWPRVGPGNIGVSAAPFSEVYLEALRELSILGSATSSLAALTAVQACLPSTVDIFSLHGNLPRSLPLPPTPASPANDGRTRSGVPAAAAPSGGRGLSRMRGFNEAFRNLFGWTGEGASRPVGADNQLAGPDQASGEEEDALPVWHVDANRAALVRSVMTMHGLSVLDIRMPPMLDLSSFRVIPSLVLMSTRLRHVTLDLRQLVELVDLGALTAATAGGPFGGYGVPLWRPLQQLDTEEGEERGTSEWMAWGTQRLLPNLREVVLREPLHIGWAVEDVVRFTSILLSLPRCTVSAAAVILHQHSLLGPIRPNVDSQVGAGGVLGDRARTGLLLRGAGQPARPAGDRMADPHRPETVGGEEILTSGEEAEASPAAAVELFQLGDVTALSDQVDLGTPPTSGELQQNAPAEFSSRYERGTAAEQPRQVAAADVGSPADATTGEDPGVHIFGPNQYVVLLRQVVEHLAPNICSLRIRYTSATTCDLPVANVAFPLLQELVLDNYLPSAHLEIDKIIVSRTHCVTLGLNGHQLQPFRQRPEWMDGGVVARAGKNFCSSQGSYLPLLRALEPVSYYFQGTEDVLFLWGINEELTAEAPASPSAGVWTGSVNHCVPVFTKPVVGCPGLLCLSLTVCGRELHDSVNEVLWEAERSRKEGAELRIGTEALGGEHDDDVDSTVSNQGEDSAPDEPAYFDGDDEDPFASFDFPTLFAAQTVPSPQVDASGGTSAGPHAWVGQGSQLAASAGPDRTGARIWSVPSAVFGGCMGCDEIDNNDASSSDCARRREASEARSGSASHGRDAGNERRARPAAGTSQAASVPTHANIFSQLASRVAAFFDEHVVGTCANALFAVPQDADRGGLLMALSLLAESFGERGTSESGALSARSPVIRETDDADNFYSPGRPAPGCAHPGRFAIPVHRKCVHLVGLNIVDFELHSVCGGCSEATVAAALAVVERRFDGVIARMPGKATSTFATGGPQRSASTPSALPTRLTVLSGLLSPRGDTCVPGHDAVCRLSALSGGGAFQAGVEDEASGRCSESSANWKCKGRTNFNGRTARAQCAVSTSRGRRRCMPAGTVSTRSSRPWKCTTGAQVDTGSRHESCCNMECESRAVEFAEPSSPPGEGSNRTRERVELSRCETDSLEEWSHKTAYEKQIAFCCPVVGRHLELFLAVFPSLQFLEFRYSGQHPMYLLDQQALRSALGSTATFLKEHCDFVETGENQQPGVVGAFARCFHTVTKLALGCQRLGTPMTGHCLHGDCFVTP